MGAVMPAISVVDVGDGGPLRHAVLRRAHARVLRDDCLTVFPRAVTPFLPALDGAARRWLTRSCSPYVPEIAQIAAALGFTGVWLLNASYQWSCTSLAREEDGVPWLARTLDWPFPGLGRHADVVRTKGPGRIFQHHLAWLCERADGDGAVPVFRLHQPGANVASHPASLAAHL